jgi:hypothetical protein
VAADARGAIAAQPWIEAAAPGHPSLLDTQLRVADLYNIRNVPAAFWIDEGGDFVRASDPVYVLRRNTETGESTRNEAYLQALRDWAAHGRESSYAQDGKALELRRGSRDRSDEEASASFQLGVYLAQHGHPEAARPHFDRAERLRPDRWTHRRQAWSYAGADRDTIVARIRDPAAPPFYPDLDLNGGG